MSAMPEFLRAQVAAHPEPAVGLDSATHAVVEVRHEGHRLVLEVSDDGCGGATAGEGSGLSGLADRVGALDGRLEVLSPRGTGTRLCVEVPCPPPS